MHATAQLFTAQWRPLILRLLTGAAVGFLLQTTPATADPNPALPDEATIRQGEYLAHMGDCFACHTARGGKPLAGGTPMNTPFGILYSTNITPDRETGIGNYTLKEFIRAMRDGVDRNGNNLFPAMPYPSYAKISDQDLSALYAYLMHGVTPVYQKNRENRIHWPFSIRQGLSVWKWLFLDDRPYQPDPTRSAAWNRGAYIIQGLGHCGSCHTPRGLGLEEKAMDERGPNGRDYLSGATIDSWYAPSLRTAQALKGIEAFLKTGRNGQAAAFGIMAEVDHFSTQKYSDSDLDAMDVYLKSLVLNAGPSSGSPPPPPFLRTENLRQGTLHHPGGTWLCSVLFLLPPAQRPGSGQPVPPPGRESLRPVAQSPLGRPCDPLRIPLRGDLGVSQGLRHAQLRGAQG